MHHDISLITLIAFGLTAALVFGLLAKRIGLSPIVGYLVAGIVIGPHTPGFVGDVGLATQLAEIGVILLMFGVGLHFHFEDLLAVRRIAIPGALGQSFAATLCGLGVAVAVGLSWQAGLVLGIAVSVASTVVLLRILTDHGLVETTEGQVSVGWLVVEDIITVLVLVLIPALTPSSEESVTLGSMAAAMGFAVLKLATLGFVVIVGGKRVVPLLLLRVARLRSRELFTLSVLVIAIAIATAGYLLFGASMALGAFLSGMVVSQSRFSHQAAADALPLRDAFAVLFFVSVGMLFDWSSIATGWPLVLGLTAVILIVKPLVALLIVVCSGYTLKTALTVAAGLAQIGEFSFIVVALARDYRILPESGYHALIASAIISISLNPWLFRSLLKLEPILQRNRRLRSLTAGRPPKHNHAQLKSTKSQSPLDSSSQAIVVGYGPVGRAVVAKLESFSLAPVVIDMNVDTIISLLSEGKRALYGDAASAEILTQAAVEKAAYLIITLPVAATGFAIATAARQLNPRIQILMRARYLGDGEMFLQAGANVICYDEEETARALTKMLKRTLQSSGEMQSAGPLVPGSETFGA